jgi:hypothetical protein
MKLQLSFSMIISFAISVSVALLLIYLAHLIGGNTQLYNTQDHLYNALCDYLNMCNGA